MTLPDEVLLAQCETVLHEIYVRAEKIIDSQTNPLYARKNPRIFEVFARIAYEEYCFLRMNTRPKKSDNAPNAWCLRCGAHIPMDQIICNGDCEQKS